MIKIVNEGLKKNLINEKWEVQKKMLSPLIASNKKEIDDYRQKINKGHSSWRRYILAPF